MRVAFLWTGISGYYNACLKELVSRPGVELVVYHEPATASAPYDESQFAWMKKRVVWNKHTDFVRLQQQLHQFNPHILIFASWNKPFYRSVAKSFAGKAWRVMGMDNCWRGTLKQWLGTLNAWYYVRPLADAVWLPGERQAIFAKKLGFAQRAILRGSYTCDSGPIAEAYLERVKAERPLPHEFLYVGRYSSEKGLNTLVSAYKAYRKSSANPWPLICCGAGPLKSVLQGHEGILVEDFVQPKDMPAKLVAAGCLILPSDFEPWALVVHEATSAGLPVIASEQVGAAVHLVQPNYNGFICGCGDVEHLASAMTRVSSMTDERLEAMSRASYSLSQQYSPSLWVDTLFASYEAASGKSAQE